MFVDFLTEANKLLWDTRAEARFNFQHFGLSRPDTAKEQSILSICQNLRQVLESVFNNLSRSRRNLNPQSFLKSPVIFSRLLANYFFVNSCMQLNIFCGIKSFDRVLRKFFNLSDERLSFLYFRIIEQASKSSPIPDFKAI